MQIISDLECEKLLELAHHTKLIEQATRIVSKSQERMATAEPPKPQVSAEERKQLVLLQA